MTPKDHGYPVERLMTDDGKQHLHYVPIPSVYIPVSDPDPRATLNRLFPAETFGDLRRKYAARFG